MTTKHIKTTRTATGGIYTTIDEDVLDHIAWRYYGTEAGTTEALFDANPGLAELGPALPAGIVINLPDSARPSAPKVAKVRLFD